MNAPQRILVAIDGSPQALEAGRLAITLAAACHATVRAVAVLGKERGEHLVDQARQSGVAPARKRRQAALEDALAHLVRVGTESGVTVEPGLRVRPQAEPYEAILDELERWSAELLLVGRGSHHGIGRALLGSQTEQLLEFARVPIVVVPARSGRT
jgi:nucleotide-binding universal stress UspA family protein